MSRYIDADKLIFSRVRIIHSDGTMGGWNAVVMSSVINSAPTADVVEVRHGEWTKSSPYNRFMNCSICGFGQDHTTFNYCPHCGAKMDGERSENGT